MLRILRHSRATRALTHSLTHPLPSSFSRTISSSAPRLESPSTPPLTPSLTPPPTPPESTPPLTPTLTHSDTTTLIDPSPATATTLSSWHPFDLVSQLVESAHLATGLPYWAVIVGTTVGVRLACVPLGIKAVQNSARMAAIRPKMNKLIEFSKANPNNNSYQKELFLLWKKNNVNPLKALAVPLFQLPLFVTFFFGIRQMGEYYPGLAEGGLLWFPDLVAHDPYFVLPVLNGASFLLMVEMNAHDQAVEHEQAATFKTAMRALAFIMVPVTMYTPAVSGSGGKLFIH
jgi:YidC/Oxa1 family membrane protein insertase